MGIIYKEIIRNKKVSVIKWLFLLVLSTLVAYVAVNSVDYSSRYKIELEFILLADAVLAMLMSKMLYEMAYADRVFYTYKLIDRELIFEKNIGNSRKIVLCVDTRDIELLIPLGEEKNLKNIERTYKFLCRPRRGSIYCCVVNHRERRIKFYFQPSNELVKKLKSIINQEP